MEIYTITKAGHKINVFFTGAKYYFYSPCFGVIAAAARIYEKSVVNYSQNDREEHFNIQYGNEHCTGGRLTNSTILSAVQNFIRTNENRFVPVRVIFEDCNYINLQNSVLKMNMEIR